SGREPHLVVGSRRGVPYRSKPDGGRAVRPFTARWATPAWFQTLAERSDVDFAAEVWPILSREFARVYLEALTELVPAAVGGDWLDALATAGAQDEVDAVLEAAIGADRWTWTLDE